MRVGLRKFFGRALYRAVKHCSSRPRTSPGPSLSLLRDLLIIKVCLWAGADPNVKVNQKTGILGKTTDKGRTALHEAACNVYVTHEIIQPLLAVGANPNDRDSVGDSPLHLLIKNAAPSWFRGYTNSLRELLAAGADPNARNASGETPLHRVRNGYDVELLARAGADPNVASPSGDTPLHHAAPRGNSMVVRALIVARADPTAENNDGATPADLAAQAKLKERVLENLLAQLHPSGGPRSQKERARESALRSGKVVPINKAGSIRAAAKPEQEREEKLRRN